MEIVYFILTLIITGLFYMIFPFIFVRMRGQTTSNKAFWLSFINWIIMHTLFLTIYNNLFPEGIGAGTSMAPALWLFFTWWYMKKPKDTTTQYNMPIRTISNKITYPNSIEDLESKFKVDFKNTYRESFTREMIRFALFIFRIDQTYLQMGQFTSVVVVNVKTNDYRYFVVEKSVGKSFVLCEWIFDNRNHDIEHLNYGAVYENKIDSSTQDIIVGNEVLIDQIHTIITMKIEPEVTSTRSESGWTFKMKKS